MSGKVRIVEWTHKGKTRRAWGYTATVAGKRVRRAGFLSKAEATAAMLEAMRPKPQTPELPTMTLSETFTRYSAVRSRKRTANEDARIARRLLAYFGDVPLASITASKVSEYKAVRLASVHHGTGKPLTAAAVNRPLGFLRAVLAMAHTEWETLASVPRIKLEREPEGRVRWLEPDEEVRLLEACRRSSIPFLHDMVVVALETGMRLGELRGLAWDRVDFSRGMIRLEITKSGRRREIPMRSRVHDVLSAMPRRLDGKVWPGTLMSKAFRRAMRAAGIEDFTFHDLRHSFASHFMMRGGSLLTLSKLLGHASLTMTMRYAHLSPEHLRGEMAKTDPRAAEGGQMVLGPLPEVRENVG
jgi:integrase